MKRVRFESPLKVRDTNIMNYDFECHSPRPFTVKQGRSIPPYRTFEHYNNCSPHLVPFTNDPIKKFDSANSSPYPSVSKTSSPTFVRPENNKFPSSDLDLSMLDFSRHEPRSLPQKMVADECGNFIPMPECILKTIEKPNTIPANSDGDDFFLKRKYISKLNEMQPLCEQVNKICLEKENNPLLKKTEIMKLGSLSQNYITKNDQQLPMNVSPYATENDYNYNCHHCAKSNTPYYVQPCHKYLGKENLHIYNQCCCLPETKTYPHLSCTPHPAHPPNQCMSHEEQLKPQLNALDKKKWALEKYEQSMKSECLEIEQQNTVVKEKREPTVSDLFKIIKLQNEQLQLLQAKVDTFIAASHRRENCVNSIQNCETEQDRLQSVDNEHHKISVGVMTSFEMVRTSTVINREVIKQGEAQIQCNRSQISIKEVVSKAQPVNINFLEGIRKKNNLDGEATLHDNGDMTKNTVFEDKTFNELSLYNVKVDNETTPQMSPEQSMFLDVKDYSDSDTDSDDPTNVGWTYYNKVMTRVNGMLQDSDMPSSASAMYRNTRQNCVMQIDKTNVSVTKRVTFGENPIEIQQPPMAVASTDTSIKMNQLAAKYLKYSQQLVQAPVAKPIVASTDMSFATKNYMEKHKLLQGNNVRPQRPQEIPKFLDITVLKQQPKLL